jgi:hypothetical protein
VPGLGSFSVDHAGAAKATTVVTTTITAAREAIDLVTLNLERSDTAEFYPR